MVVHKTSRITSEEADGFEASAHENAIDTVELLTVRRSFTRLFREGTYLPGSRVAGGSETLCGCRTRRRAAQFEPVVSHYIGRAQ